MRYLQTYKLFESIGDDINDKVYQLKSEYENGIKKLKDEYRQAVLDCLRDLTDDYDHDIEVVYQDLMTDIDVTVAFTIPLEKLDNFLNTLDGLNDLVKSYISSKKSISISWCALMDEAGRFTGQPMWKLLQNRNTPDGVRNWYRLMLKTGALKHPKMVDKNKGIFLKIKI